MRIFVTGATGFIGSQIVGALLARGDQVLGLARSDATAAALTERGAAVWRGDLVDPATLAAAARDSDGVIMVTTSGTGVAPPGGDERDAATIEGFTQVRGLPDRQAVAAADEGIRSSVIRLPPSVHDVDRQGLVSMMIERARESGFSAYVGDGLNRWPAVHRRDAARLFVLALDRAQPGARLHAVGEEGVQLRAIAEAIGSGLGLPVRSLTQEEAGPHFGFLAMLIGVDTPAKSAITRETMGWTPTEPGLLEGLRTGGYLT
jgi:nucleoside-diphosphate-sugar epimerase